MTSAAIRSKSVVLLLLLALSVSFSSHQSELLGSVNVRPVRRQQFLLNYNSTYTTGQILT